MPHWFTFQIDLGSAVVAVVGVVLAWAVRSVKDEVRTFLMRLDKYENVMDAHTSILSRMGWRPDADVWFKRPPEMMFRTRATDHPKGHQGQGPADLSSAGGEA